MTTIVIGPDDKISGTATVTPPPEPAPEVETPDTEEDA